jgi:hypothetical protein
MSVIFFLEKEVLIPARLSVIFFLEKEVLIRVRPHDATLSVTESLDPGSSTRRDALSDGIARLVSLQSGHFIEIIIDNRIIVKMND